MNEHTLEPKHFSLRVSRSVTNLNKSDQSTTSAPTIDRYIKKLKEESLTERKEVGKLKVGRESKFQRFEWTKFESEFKASSLAVGDVGKTVGERAS